MLWSCDKEFVDTQQPTSSDAGLNETDGQLWAIISAEYGRADSQLPSVAEGFSTEPMEGRMVFHLNFNK